MTDAPAQSFFRHKILRHRTWILLGLILLLVVVVRVRLREMPLERDEGEYAYAGQLILQGIPPYKLAYNMKLPGTYAAYAALMAVFGQTVSGIHLGFTLVNLACILLVFRLGRKLLDDNAGLAAAATYAILSLSPSVLGLSAHATHFVVLPALGGCLLLLSGSETGRRRTLLGSGLLFGTAFLMKQHGVLFGAFGFFYLVWVRVRVQGEQHEWSRIRARQHPFDWGKFLGETGSFAVGLLAPYLIICALLGLAGVFPQFWFWTVSYAAKYVSGLPLQNRSDLFRNAVNIVTSPNLFFWLLAILGAILMWSDKRLKRAKVFLAALLVASCIAISIGGYFREHYFVLMLPAVALLAGAAVSRGLLLLKRSQSADRLLALPTLGLLALGIGSTSILHGDVWFSLSPVKTMQQIYGSNLFPEAVGIGEFLRANTAPQATVAVIGSEPEIYFYARRHSATGYIYVYSLMELHPYALKMQEEMIAEVERSSPEYIVYVETPDSWLRQPASQKRLDAWWKTYWAAHYDLVRSIDILKEKREGDQEAPSTWGYVLLLKRKPAPHR